MYNLWVWMYERHNGFLGRRKTNGRGGGELEATLMRGWWKTQLVETLVCAAWKTGVCLDRLIMVFELDSKSTLIA